MKQVIRSNTFETNSSSLHSLVLFGGGSEEGLDQLDKEKHIIEVGEFGWEKEIYKTPLEVLTYLWTYATTEQPDLKKYFKEYMPNTKFIEPIRYEGYIDHGEAWEEDFSKLFETKESFAKAVLSGEIRTWNDNTYIEEDPNFLNPKEASKVLLKYN